ncbi:Mitochondrial distribution and morphology protein family 31/32, fungi [Phaffia rhodozyma]|uniref:Mitochondrial distribution and morphology protein family 31/32, fungi n=1 Tax=Phaffia rhodozyma TaxID=264483 RepID=A0A0F7SLL2_PHARH|nr:Mitochondrial distribution and morphology protein family 31/32, fungi [Phaffia rhodozyma]
MSVSRRTLDRSSRRLLSSASFERYAIVQTFFHVQRRSAPLVLGTSRSLGRSSRPPSSFLFSQLSYRSFSHSLFRSAAVPPTPSSRSPPSVDGSLSDGRGTFGHSHPPASSSQPPEPPPDDPASVPSSSSSSSTFSLPSSSSSQSSSPPSTSPSPSSASPSPYSHEALIQTYPPSLRRLASLLPESQSRPSKHDLLKLSTNWFERLRIRWKWLTIRGFRKFNADEWSALVSWILVGHLGWLVLGTTTFVGMVLWTANSLDLQDYIARALSDYFTQGSGITVVFESALVPNLLKSTITLRNVYISRRPLTSPSYSSIPQVLRDVSSDGDPSLIAPDPDPLPSASSVSLDEKEEKNEEEEEDTNYTMFDVNVDQIDVELSFVSWLNGEGLVKRALVKGVRGVFDRRNVVWDPSDPWIPSEWRHPTQPGDGSFNLSSFQVEDLLCTVYQPGGFRPFNVSIFKAELGRFRKKWLFYDVLSADSITGQYDNCLFSLHKPQRIGKTVGEDLKEGRWQRMARLRIDGLPIDHLQGSSSSGPLAWITSGKLDGVMDVKFPRHPDDEVDFTSVLTEIIGNVNEIASGNSPHSSSWAADQRLVINPGQRPLGKPALVAPGPGSSPTKEPTRDAHTGANDKQGSENQEERRVVVVDVDLRFRDLKAAVPYMPSELSYVNAALIRPIVAFINANRTLLPIQCQVISDLSEFDGSWTPFETGLLDATSNQVYAALAHHVTSQQANQQRMRSVGVWTLQMTAEAVVSAVRAVLLQRQSLGLSEMNLDLDPPF